MLSDQEAPIPVILKQSNVFLFLFGRAGRGLKYFNDPQTRFVASSLALDRLQIALCYAVM